MNKILHGFVLLIFSAACWFMAMMLRLPAMVGAHVPSVPLPAFTRFCMGIGPLVLAGLALAAAVYCIYVWSRKAESRATWIGFLATTMSSLVLVLLPILVAMYLPLVAFVNRLPAQ